MFLNCSQSLSDAVFCLDSASDIFFSKTEVGIWRICSSGRFRDFANFCAVSGEICNGFKSLASCIFHKCLLIKRLDLVCENYSSLFFPKPIDFRLSMIDDPTDIGTVAIKNKNSYKGCHKYKRPIIKLKNQTVGQGSSSGCHRG